MKAELYVNKSAQENAARYYDEAKRLREKAKRAEKAAADTEAKLKVLEKKAKEAAATATAPAIRVKREKQWFERFHWFTTSGGRLCIAGRDARQNEALVARHLEKGDLFFHAEVHGAPATILKNGSTASQEEKGEAAQFAGSYSSAWKAGSASIDVYAVTPEQVSKRAESGEALGKGGFIIRGGREWFRNTPLSLLIAAGSNGVESAPALLGASSFKSSAKVFPGSMEKSDAAKKIARALGASVDEVLQALPSGSASLG